MQHVDAYTVRKNGDILVQRYLQPKKKLKLRCQGAAMPTSNQGPHWTLMALRPCRCQWWAKASKPDWSGSDSEWKDAVTHPFVEAGRGQSHQSQSRKGIIKRRVSDTAKQYPPDYLEDGISASTPKGLACTNLQKRIWKPMTFSFLLGRGKRQPELQERLPESGCPVLTKHQNQELGPIPAAPSQIETKTQVLAAA